MGLCLCRHIFEDDNQMNCKYKQHREMSIVKNRIQGKKVPVIWMNGNQDSGVHTHGYNIADRFGYAHIHLPQRTPDKSSTNLLKTKLATKSKSDVHILNCIKEQMIDVGETKGYLVTGFPTNLKQVKLFLREIGPVDCIIYLEGEAQVHSVVEEPIGDLNPPEARRTHDHKNLLDDYDKYNIILEKISANEPAADVFLKIEATILDRLASNLI